MLHIAVRPQIIPGVRESAAVKLLAWAREQSDMIVSGNLEAFRVELEGLAVDCVYSRTLQAFSSALSA
jgi:hypothetical protein